MDIKNFHSFHPLFSCSNLSKPWNVGGSGAGRRIHCMGVQGHLTEEKVARFYVCPMLHCNFQPDTTIHCRRDPLVPAILLYG